MNLIVDLYATTLLGINDISRKINDLGILYASAKSGYGDRILLENAVVPAGTVLPQWIMEASK